MSSRGSAVLVTLVLALVCGLVVGAAVYVGIGDQYTAYAALHIAMQPERVVMDNGSGTPDHDRFEIFKATQQELLHAKTVLLSAIRKPEAKDIPIVQYETQYGDPVDWLTRKLSVTFPGNAEIMTVSLSLDDPKQAQMLVKAVVDSYMTDVVLADSERKQRRYDDVDRACGEKEQEIRNKREELKALANQTGGSDNPELAVARQKVALAELAVYTAERAKNEFEIARLKGVLAGKRALLQEIDKTPIDAAELETLVKNDPRARDLSAKLASEQAGQPNGEAAGAKALQAQYDARVKELTEQIRTNRRAATVQKVIELEPQLKSLEESQKVATRKIEKLASQAEHCGESVDVQMIRAKLTKLDQVLTKLVGEREKLAMEVKARPRITVQEPAGRPLTPSNTLARLVFSVAAMLATFCCIAFVGILWCILARRGRTAGR